MKRKIFKPVSYPETEVVILAGGQARRMNGINKLLQKFDDEIQLIKIEPSTDNTTVDSAKPESSDKATKDKSKKKSKKENKD